MSRKKPAAPAKDPPRRVCGFCAALTPLTSYGFLAHHLRGACTCEGSQTKRWDGEDGEKNESAEQQAIET